MKSGINTRENAAAIRPKNDKFDILGVSLGPNKSTFWGEHTHFSVEIGLNGGFSPKFVEIGRKPGFSGPGGQKHRFWVADETFYILHG